VNKNDRYTERGTRKNSCMYVASTDLKERVSYLLIAIHNVFDLFIYKTTLGIQYVERVRAELKFHICMY